MATEFGWVAWGLDGIFVSGDLWSWASLDGPWANQPGWTQFVATSFTTTAVLRSAAAQAESTVASLWTTSDGTTWPPEFATFKSQYFGDNTANDRLHPEWNTGRRAAKLQAFHDYCQSRRMGYELW